MAAKISTKTVLQLLALTVLFTGLNYIGAAVYHRAGGFTTVKPFCGVALAILLIGGQRALWPVLIAGTIGGIVAKLEVGLTFVDTVTTLGMAIASLLLTYLLTRRLIGQVVEFRSWKQLLGFIAIAIAVSALSAFGFAFTGHDIFASTGFGTNFVPGGFRQVCPLSSSHR